jgi:hypothetical protein
MRASWFEFGVVRNPILAGGLLMRQWLRLQPAFIAC